MIKPGEEWGVACSDPPDIEVCGGDHDLALAVAEHPGALFRFAPNDQSDLARAVGLRSGDTPRNWAVPMDALRVDEHRIAVNMLILGTRPGRISRWTRAFRIDGEKEPALSAVVATGQYRASLDIVPRSHPGDGWAELQIYQLPKGDRAEFRKRLATGTHIPHASITQRRIHTITLTTPNPVPLEIDGVRTDPVRELAVTVVPNAYRLLL
jgi:hypothetical protein